MQLAEGTFSSISSFLFLLLVLLLPPTHAAFRLRNTGVAMETGNRDAWSHRLVGRLEMARLRRNQDRQRLRHTGLLSCGMHHMYAHTCTFPTSFHPLLASHKSNLGFIFVSASRQRDCSKKTVRVHVIFRTVTHMISVVCEYK